MKERKPSPVPLDGAYLTVKEAADAFRLRPNMIYRLAAAGEIPHYRFGKKTLRFLRSDLEDWARQHRET